MFAINYFTPALKVVDCLLFFQEKHWNIQFAEQMIMQLIINTK